MKQLSEVGLKSQQKFSSCYWRFLLYFFVVDKDLIQGKTLTQENGQNVQHPSIRSWQIILYNGSPHFIFSLNHSKLLIIVWTKILNHYSYWLSILTYYRSLHKSSFHSLTNCQTCLMSQHKIPSRSFSLLSKLFLTGLFTQEFHYLKLF